MKWIGRAESSNVEDRRGGRVSTVTKGGGAITVIIIIAAYFLKVDPSTIQKFVPSDGKTTTTNRPLENDEAKKFVAVVLKDTEDVWHKLFKNMRKRYQEPKLVVFSETTDSRCGRAEATMGPFYCPADQKVYIDLNFFKELKRRHHAPGDFAQAYVVAHEVAHHVQNLLGTSTMVHRKQQKFGRGTPESNKLSVKLELQADCYSGIWAHHADKMKNILEKGDIKEALNAASQIGDDTLQKQAGVKYVNQESFTHGTSAQRVKWFKIGKKTGSLEACDTFR